MVGGKKGKKSKQTSSESSIVSSSEIIEQGVVYECNEPLFAPENLGVSFTLPGMPKK